MIDLPSEIGAAASNGRHAPVWFGRPDAQRRLTVEHVRARCSPLGPHRRSPWGAEVAAPRPSALLVPVTRLDGEAAVVVTKRPPTMLHQQNDWVFPGGRLDPARDESTLHTALREGSEELGAPEHRIEVVRRLTTQGPIVTGFLIDVYVGLVELSDLAPDSAEVADWAVLPISVLTDPRRYRRGGPAPPHATGPTVAAIPAAAAGRAGDLHFFSIREDEELWGTQGIVLHELLDLLFRESDLAREEA